MLSLLKLVRQKISLLDLFLGWNQTAIFVFKRQWRCLRGNRRMVCLGTNGAIYSKGKPNLWRGCIHNAPKCPLTGPPWNFNQPGIVQLLVVSQATGSSKSSEMVCCNHRCTFWNLNFAIDALLTKWITDDALFPNYKKTMCVIGAIDATLNIWVI